MHDLSRLAKSGEEGALDGIVLVANMSGANASPGDVLALSDPFISPGSNPTEFRNALNFKGTLPTEAYAGRFGILLDGGGPEQLIPAVIWGPAWAKISMQRESDRFADIYAGDRTRLKSGASGSAQILYAYPMSSSYPQDTFAYVRLGNVYSGLRRARFTETMDDENPVASAKVWDLDPTAGDYGEYVELEETVELRCWLRPEGETIEERTRCYFAKIGDVLEAIVINCEPDPSDEEESPGEGG
jgi:hypothetical protein